MDWFDLAQDKDQWMALMILRVPEIVEKLLSM
jgi:hypothetical protein